MRHRNRPAASSICLRSPIFRGQLIGRIQAKTTERDDAAWPCNPGRLRDQGLVVNAKRALGLTRADNLLRLPREPIVSAGDRQPTQVQVVLNLARGRGFNAARAGRATLETTPRPSASRSAEHRGIDNIFSSANRLQGAKARESLMNRVGFAAHGAARTLRAPTLDRRAHLNDALDCGHASQST
jgi:hypothetical protein